MIQGKTKTSTTEYILFNARPTKTTSGTQVKRLSERGQRKKQQVIRSSKDTLYFIHPFETKQHFQLQLKIKFYPLRHSRGNDRVNFTYSKVAKDIEKEMKTSDSTSKSKR